MIHNLSISVYLPIYEYKKESRNSGSDNARENKQQTKRPGSRRTDNSVGVYVQPCGDANENYTGNYCSLFFEGFCRGRGGGRLSDDKWLYDRRQRITQGRIADVWCARHHDTFISAVGALSLMYLIG